MNRSTLFGLIFLVSTSFSILPAHADDPTIEPWVLLGAQDVLLNGICSSENLLFATTEEGFHFYNHQTAQWTDRTWPGWIGRAKYAVVIGQDTDERLVSGGVNAWFKGTLFYSDDNGENETLTLESNGGRVTDLAVSLWDESAIYACTWADVVDGEFLRSNDDGESWSLVTGHGHHTMTDLAVLGPEEVFLAGDNYVTLTLDGGQTWDNLQGNLPESQGIYCLLAQPPVAGLPSPDKDDDPIVDRLMVSNDTGFYLHDFETGQWDVILPTSCRAVAARFRQISTFVYWGETYAVTWDHRVMFCKNSDWDNWQDVTNELGPGVPIDIEANAWGVFVALQGGGVYRSDGHLPTSDVPDAQPMLHLTAYPNPFNPATTIKFETPKAGHGLLQVFDVRGALVETLLNGEISAGLHTKSWRPVGLSSGVYRVVFQTEGQTVSDQIVLLK